MIRARLERMGKEYHLGKFHTQTEVKAAKEAACRVLDRVESDAIQSPPPPQVMKKPPSMEILRKLVGAGVYDSDPEGMRVGALTLGSRFKMVSEGRRAASPAVNDLDLDQIAQISGQSIDFDDSRH